MNSSVAGLDSDRERPAPWLPWRVGGVALTFACVAGLLSGCVENVGAVQVSVVGGEFAVAFCNAQTISSLSFEQLRPGDNRAVKWPTLWEATGPIGVNAGDVVVATESADGWTSGDHVTLDTSQGVDYRVDVESEEYGTYSPTVKSPRGGLKEGEWITTSGEITELPCT